ncbi:hypothetical protein L6R49_00075 [Myxococcota bacterium]|nr:hypothetical protein [Myxococcota bacterium]
MRALIQTLSSIALIPLLISLSACGKDEVVVDDTSSIYPEGLAPLAENTASAPASTEGDPWPEQLSVVSDGEAEPMWVHARGYIQAPVATVWAALATPEVVVDRRVVGEWTVQEDDPPRYDVGFLLHYLVFDVVTVEFDLQWDQAVVGGSAAAPTQVAARMTKVDGTVFISLMECSVLLVEVAEGVTEVQLVYQLESATGEIEPAAAYVTDLFGSLKAVAHGEPLPTYD